MNIFQFKHVGDGLFYTGSILDEFNFVYDCGSGNNYAMLIDEIDNMRLYSEDIAIDFVAVSQLERKYFSGLPYLCQRYFVKRLYLPYLGENKELIRLMLISAIFGAGTKDKVEKKWLYAFMCKLYGVECDYHPETKWKLPRQVIFLGQAETLKEVDYDAEWGVIRCNNLLERHQLWTFNFIYRALNRKAFSVIDGNFKKAVPKGRNLEEYLFDLIRTEQGLRELRQLNIDIFGYGSDEYNKVASTVLLHYPRASHYNIYVNEYRTVSKYPLCGPQQKYSGNFTILTGNTDIDEVYEGKILSGGNFSMFAGVMNVPRNAKLNNWKNIFKLSLPFKALIFTADTTDKSYLSIEVIPNLLAMYPNRYARIVTENTGITYFIE